MAPASASLLPVTSSNAAGAKRPSNAAAAASDAEHPLAQGDQDGVAAGKNNQSGQQQQLECPRCKSSNTKFCYYNNYSTTQPRHFCRACRRYWTHGGTLRNVPVGGACRRGGGGSGASKRRRSAEPSPSSASPTEDAAYRPDIQATPLFPFLSDGAFLPQFDLGFGGGAAAATTGFPWRPTSAAATDLYDGLAAPWGGSGDGTLSSGAAWDDFTGFNLTWPPPPAAGN